jgi:hypothetical protein
MFMVDEHYQIRQRTSQFFAAQLITQEWAEPKDAEHKLFAASSDVRNSQGHMLVTAYALQRPDGQWALMLINKDHDNSHSVGIVFQDTSSNQNQSFLGSVTSISFGKAQYQWHPNRKNGYAEPDLLPVTSTLAGSENALYDLPAASLTIVRGRLGGSLSGRSAPAK